MCEEIGINLSCFRSIADRDEMLQKWTELSTYNTSKTFLLVFITACKSIFFFVNLLTLYIQKNAQIT